MNSAITGKTYHIYYEDKCLFKNLSEEDFHFIWDKIYLSYHTDSLSFATCIGDECTMEEMSF